VNESENAQPADPSAPAEELAPVRGGHPIVLYTLLRLAILAAVGLVLYFAGMRGPLLIIFSLLISGVVSVFALNRRREVAAVGITTAIQRVGQRIDASSRAEDVDDDADFEPDPASPEGSDR
jgi:hypothetical protein